MEEFQSKDYIKAIELYGQYYENNKKKIMELLNLLREKDKVVIWGAGIKGKALLTILDEYHQLIDMDKDKQNKKLPTGI